MLTGSSNVEERRMAWGCGGHSPVCRQRRVSYGQEWTTSVERQPRRLPGGGGSPGKGETCPTLRAEQDVECPLREGSSHVLGELHVLPSDWLGKGL